MYKKTGSVVSVSGGDSSKRNRQFEGFENKQPYNNQKITRYYNVVCVVMNVTHSRTGTVRYRSQSSEFILVPHHRSCRRPLKKERCWASLLLILINPFAESQKKLKKKEIISQEDKKRENPTPNQTSQAFCFFLLPFLIQERSKYRDRT